jgi:hypothetical protein
MKPKALLILSLLLMLTPSFLYWLGPLRRPAMVDGDQLVMLACPQCSGSGQLEGKKCGRCRGKKEVQHVKPSVHRPTYFMGQVYAPDGVTTVAEAQVTFSSPAGSWTRKTDEVGRFGADLPPGKYPLEIVSAQGKLSTTIEIAPQTSPSPVDLDPRFPTLNQPYVLKSP